MESIKMLNEHEIADAIGQSYWFVRELRVKEGLPYMKFGRRIYYNMDDVLTWFAERRRKSMTTSNKMDKIY